MISESEIPPKPFHIYRSGAGSGKTYTLAKSYLTLALSRPGAFRNILGVTFTNKATEEMKSRIVKFLKELSTGKDQPMRQELREALRISDKELTKRANEALSDILHQYGRFSIVTIDSFFHAVIRSFAREMGLQGTFTIDLDLDKVLQIVIDELLLEIGEEKQKQLRKWLTEFAEHKVEEGLSWDFRKDISALSKEILKDEFKQYSTDILKLSEQKNFFGNLRKELNEVKYPFENQVKKLCREAVKFIEDNGLSIDSFSRKASGPAGLFVKLENLDFDISDTRRAAMEDVTKWLTKADQKDVAKVAITEKVMVLYADLINYVDQEFIKYNSVIEVQRYLYAFGILAEINKYLTKYRDENDVMLIADLPDFLHQIINDSDTPYIYEKVGSVYNHYLIDEFQDTSAFQWDNFKPLVKNTTDEGNFSMVVGDVKQSIYRFRGGDWELLQNRVKDDIGDYHVEPHNLGTNWRSDPAIVRFNNQFFTNMMGVSRGHFEDMTSEILNDGIRQEVLGKIGEVFETFSDVAQEIPEHRTEENGMIRFEFIKEERDAEEGWVDQSIRKTIEQVEQLQRQGYELRDIAVLTRYASEGKKIADAFIDFRNSPEADPNLRYEVVSSEALYLTSSHLVRFVVSLIKWLNDEKNTIVLSEWLYEYNRYILKNGLKESEIFARFDRWEELAPKNFIGQRDYLKTLPLYELVESLIRIFDLHKIPEEFTYLQGFQDAVLDYAKNERGDIPSFLTWWEEIRKTRSIKVSDDNNAVKILTIHKSKGLEFPVVILPFMSWTFDHDASKDTILWCAGDVGVAPFNKVPVVPLKYNKGLANTYWAQRYYEEKLKAYLDNLNLLYVAFTRPVEVLIGFAKLPAKSDMKYAYDLVLNQVKETEQWSEEENVYQVGSIPKPTHEQKVTAEYGLESYISSPWRGKVSIQIKGNEELNETVFNDAQRRGTKLHDILSQIKYKKDLDQFSNLEHIVELTKIIEHPEVANWFEESWEVHTEVPILLPGGDFKRIDRLNRKDNATVIIDFKTGTKRKKDHYQVKEYMQLLGEMGYLNIKGYLIYLYDLSVEEVI
ncbi:UvrD-helicase domain-containing protein [Marinoscillum pacificum]|uniref:UvrD-helicase domain-containing protein n=1 Tax=Marinoscillum pacificum TaxID=392723 RepID=UPI002158A0DD|nr:UvrD-helicase domain-containing protein [Marinoscillum pacificum]